MPQKEKQCSDKGTETDKPGKDPFLERRKVQSLVIKKLLAEIDPSVVPEVHDLKAGDHKDKKKSKETRI